MIYSYNWIKSGIRKGESSVGHENNIRKQLEPLSESSKYTLLLICS